MRVFFSWYAKKLDTNPIFTKCMTASGINVLGDGICQLLQKKQKNELGTPFDWKRSATFGTMGFFYVAPMLHMNYSFILPSLVPATAKLATLKKVCIDQTFFAGVMNIGFFTFLNLLEGKTLQNAKKELEVNLWKTM